MNSKKLKRVILGLFLAGIIVCIMGSAYYVYKSFIYVPDAVAMACLESNDKVTVRRGSGYYAFEPKEPEAMVILYPDSIADYRTYAPLMQELSDRNILAVVCKMPCSFVFLGKNRADFLADKYPEITNRYMAAHGLSGKAATKYAALHEEQFNGVILLAGYPAKELADTKLSCLSIYGDRDGVFSPFRNKLNSDNFPENTEEFVIEGANHAQFANYGTEVGDKTAEISSDEQLAITADKILEFITKDMSADGSDKVSDGTDAQTQTAESTEAVSETENTTEKKISEEAEETTKKTSKKTVEETTKKSSKKTAEETTKKTEKKAVEETTVKKTKKSASAEEKTTVAKKKTAKKTSSDKKS